MNVSSASASAFDQQYAVAVAAKQLDAQKQEGQSSVQLIAAAGATAPVAPPPRAGQTISVYA